MTFYLLLALINIACFLPMYVLNIREQPNPFVFLKDARIFSVAMIKRLYARRRYTDPFRINFDYTFLVLALSHFENAPQWVPISLSLVLAFGFIEILYSTIMHLVFRRAPSIFSDISLLRTGWSVAHKHRYVIMVAAIVLFVVVFGLAGIVTQYLDSIAPVPNNLALLFAAILIGPCLYHWRSFLYSDFIWRVTYSPVLHLYRNFQFSIRTRGIVNQSSEYFDGLNDFKAVKFKGRPNIVIVCIESYGSIVFNDVALHSVIANSVAGFGGRLESKGCRIASNFSEAPIFAGGSWLSYSSLTYGMLFDDAYVHEGLFDNNSSFGSYESLFHILERNGYSNNLLCPLGGVASRYVNWESLDRCFRPRRKFDFDSLSYKGNTNSFFMPNDLYAAPDQYALNYAYESIKTSDCSPFSLFFCTLNSHYPWTSPQDIVEDWRQLNEKANSPPKPDEHNDVRTAYALSIKYQLEFILKFVADNSEDELLVIAFGDHQPPVIASEAMGKHTPIHVFSRDAKLVDEFFKNGFAPTLDLREEQVEPIRHEGFLSLLMAAMNATYGEDPSLKIKYRKNGVSLHNGS